MSLGMLTSLKYQKHLQGSLVFCTNLTIYNSLIHPHFIYGLYLWRLKCRRIKVLQKKAVRILAFKPYISHSTPIFKIPQILKIEDLYTVQLYKLCYKLRTNLFLSYFRTFTPYYHDDHHTHDVRYTILRLPMTRRKYFAECTKYQFFKLIRETSQTDLDHSTNLLFSNSHPISIVILLCVM